MTIGRGERYATMKRIARFNFCDPGWGVLAPGYRPIGRVYGSPRFLWIDEVRERWSRGVEDPVLMTSIIDSRGEFRVGLPAGRYVLRLTFYDPDAEHGPFDLTAASVAARAPGGSGEARALLEGVVVPRGRILRTEVAVAHTGGALALRFSGQGTASFIVNALEIDGPDAAELEVLFPEAPTDVLPTIDRVVAEGQDDPVTALRNVCEWLLGKCRSDGFLGDGRYWYTASYPIRALVAAYDIFGEPRYLEAAQMVLDRLVAEQMPTGAFTNVCRGRATAELTEPELREVADRYWMNLADVGSIVAALIVASRSVTGERQARYVAAAKSYCDRWARQFQQASGGFTNGWLAGHYARCLYSVATATSALTFALLGAVTREASYAEVAQRAVDFLVKDWNDDGRPHIWPHDDDFPGAPFDQPVTCFGDQVYILEGIAGAAVLSPELTLRQRALTALRKYLFGSNGLLAARGDAPWWRSSEMWTSSKSAALPIFLQLFRDLGAEIGATSEELKRVEDAYRVSRKFLCTPEFAHRLGIMVDEPDLPWGGQSLQSWACCTVAATGFAGIALANMIRPGIIFLR
jgi:hypothetical protein